MLLATLKSDLAAKLKEFETAVATDLPKLEADALALVDKAEGEIEKLFEDAKTEAVKGAGLVKEDAAAARVLLTMSHNGLTHLETLGSAIARVYEEVKAKIISKL